MGILDDLFGTKTTEATDAATQTAQSNLASTGALNTGILNSTTNQARGAVTAGAAGATDAINSGYGAGTGALSAYYTAAQNALASGTGQAVTTAQSSNGLYSPYATNGGSANGLLSDALGVNGTAGNAAATSAFQASPGYAYSVDQASDAAARKAASLGLSASGNTLSAITTLGQNLANQDYSSWLSNLSGLGSQGLTAAAGVSGNNQAAASLQGNAATTGAGLYQTTGQNIGTLDAAQGNALAGVSTGLGNSLGTLDTALGTNKVANNTGIATATNTLGVADANAQDAAANANSGIFSKALGTLFAPETSAVTSKIGGVLGKATGGFL